MPASQNVTDHLEPSALHTAFCDLAGIRYPIVKAGMGGGTDTPELVAAVSEAGGLGLFGGIMLTGDDLRAAIRRIKSLTSRPFGVNIVVHPPQPEERDASAIEPVLAQLRDAMGIEPGETAPRSGGAPPASGIQAQLAVMAEEGVPVLNTMGDPTPLIGPAHAAGILVIAIVTTPAEARLAARAGADAIVAQGAEAGGLRGTFRLEPGQDPPLIGTVVLVPAVIDALVAEGFGGIPVLAAGGIMDGRGIAAVLALGAAGVLLGTRFAAASEAGIFPNWRETLLAATAEDAIVSRSITGRPARAFRNRLVAQVSAAAAAGTQPLSYPHQVIALTPIMETARARENADFLYLAAGQGVSALTRTERAAEIVATLVAETQGVLDRLASSH